MILFLVLFLGYGKILWISPDLKDTIYISSANNVYMHNNDIKDVDSLWVNWCNWKADSAKYADTADYYVVQKIGREDYLWEYDAQGALMPSEVVVSGDLWMMDLGLDVMPAKGWGWDKHWEQVIVGTDTLLVPKP